MDKHCIMRPRTGHRRNSERLYRPSYTRLWSTVMLEYEPVAEMPNVKSVVFLYELVSGDLDAATIDGMSNIISEYWKIHRHGLSVSCIYKATISVCLVVYL